MQMIESSGPAKSLYRITFHGLKFGGRSAWIANLRKLHSSVILR